jgi:hypothetical protein
MHIEGNEHADQEAKRAAIDPTVPPIVHTSVVQTPSLKVFKNPTDQSHGQNPVEQTMDRGHENIKYLRRISSKQGIQLGSKLYNSISRRKICAQIQREDGPITKRYSD